MRFLVTPPPTLFHPLCVSPVFFGFSESGFLPLARVDLELVFQLFDTSFIN